MSSLKFLSNLRRIHGDPLENRHYALILYDNKQLKDLWEPTVQLELVTGGMFMHRNNKLCNQHIREFQYLVLHDKVMDSLQTSDQEVLCGPAKLQLSVKVWDTTFGACLSDPLTNATFLALPSRFVPIVRYILVGPKRRQVRN